MGFIEITGRRMSGGDRHEHIIEVRAVDRSGRVLYARPEEVIRWLDVTTNVAVVYTRSRSTRFIVGPYRAPGGVACLRAYTGTGWEDHLLDLPEYPERANPPDPRERLPMGSPRADALARR